MHISRYCFFTLVFTAILFSSQTSAQVADQPAEISAIYNCKAEIDPTKRLACYDAAVGRLEIAQKTGEVVAVSKTQVENVEREAFGFNIPSLPSLGNLFGSGQKSTKQEKPKDNPLTAPVKTAEIPDAITTPSTPPATIAPPKASEIKDVTLTLQKTTEFGYKKTRFFFTNGQVWEQTDGTKVRVPKVRNNVANQARISKASLGSFFLRVNGKGTAVRVRRVR